MVAGSSEQRQQRYTIHQRPTGSHQILRAVMHSHMSVCRPQNKSVGVEAYRSHMFHQSAKLADPQFLGAVIEVIAFLGI